MVNRVIAAKDRKRKMRHKQKVWHGKPVSTGPSVGGLQLYKHKLVDDGVDRYLAAKFPQKYIYSDDMLIARNQMNKEKSSLLGEEANPFPLGEVKLLIRNLQEKMNETIMENHFKLRNKSWHKIDLFFNAQKTCWMMIEMKSLGGEQFIRRSVIFSSKALAVQALRLSMVEWVETIYLQ